MPEVTIPTRSLDSAQPIVYKFHSNFGHSNILKLRVNVNPLIKKIRK